MTKLKISLLSLGFFYWNIRRKPKVQHSQQNSALVLAYKWFIVVLFIAPAELQLLDLVHSHPGFIFNITTALHAKPAVPKNRYRFKTLRRCQLRKHCFIYQLWTLTRMSFNCRYPTNTKISAIFSEYGSLNFDKNENGYFNVIWQK